MTRPLAILLLLVAAFCAYGFLATFEPHLNAPHVRVGYALVGLICLSAVVVRYVRQLLRQ